MNLKAEIGLPDSITKQLIWKSSNTKVAIVNANGVVTVKKKTGGKKVTITASNDKIKVSAFKFTFLPAAICFGLPVALKGYIAGAFVVLPDGFVVLLDGFWVS